MKKINWKEYYNLAKELFNSSGKLSSNQEVIMRTVTSRAYYATFLMARNHLRDKEGKSINETGKVHSFVISEFSRSSEPTRSTIGAKLKKLRILRNLADYEDVLRNPKYLARQSLDLAQEIIIGLEKL